MTTQFFNGDRVYHKTFGNGEVKMNVFEPEGMGHVKFDCGISYPVHIGDLKKLKKLYCMEMAYIYPLGTFLDLEEDLKKIIEYREHPDYNRFVKHVHNLTRKLLNISNVIGFGHKANGDIMIFEYPLEATKDNHYKQKHEVFEEEDGENFYRHYIEVIDEDS